MSLPPSVTRALLKATCDKTALDRKALRELSPDGLTCQGREVQLVFGFDAEQLRRQLDAVLEKTALSPPV